MIPLLSVAEMRAADAGAVARGRSSFALMEAAGWQVARAIRNRFPPRLVLVLAGPGNNGGDGFVAARQLAGWGWPVRIALLGKRDSLTGDARLAADRCPCPLVPFERQALAGRPLVVDALFGTGLSRPLEGAAADLLRAVSEMGLDIVAVDIPSGVDGDSGLVLGMAAQAALTVTFFRPKTGHFLLPGRRLAGDLVVGDIGIAPGLPEDPAPNCFLNEPGLWSAHLPPWRAEGHKYSRGHVLLASGPSMTGAVRLAALAARRMGAGLATIAAPAAALAVLRGTEAGNIVLAADAWSSLLEDERRNACVIGPGLGTGQAARAMVLDAMATGKACVLDADALTSFAGDAQTLWATGGKAVLTPHDGEFARLFDHGGDRLSRARAGAAESGAVVVLKGADTVVAAPDGRAAIAANAPPSLATGGTGDVLAGMVGGLLAQGMPAFEAAACAVWMHGAAALHLGSGLVAEDLAGALPAVWSDLADDKRR